MNEEENIDKPINKNALTSWENEPGYDDLYADYQSAQEDHSQVITKLDIRKVNFEGGPLIRVPKGKSQVRPKVIRKQAEWKYPSLEEPFLNTQDMFEIKPRTFEDTDAAKQNELLLNYQWAVKVDKVELVGDAVRTLVDEGTVIVKTGWEIEEEMVDVEYEVPVYANAQQSFQILQQQVTSGNMTPEQAQQMIASGQPVQIGTTIEVVEEPRLVKNQPSYEVCDNRNVILDPTANGVKENLNFVIHEYDTNMSELKKQEYYKEIEIDEETGEEFIDEGGIYHNLSKIKISRTTDTREYYNDTETNETNFEFQDDPRKVLRAYEYWGYWDIHGNGEIVPIIATWIGKVMIRMEESPFPFKGLPFSFAKYMPVKNEMYGEADGDLLIENQESIGKMTRAAHDITSDHAVGQEFIDEQFFAGPSQKDNYKSGKTVYFRNGMDPKTSIFKQSIDPVPKAVFDMIAMQNADAESLSGTKSFSQGIGSQALGSVATGIRSALDATSKRELSILRRLSEQLFKDLASKTIMMNQAFLEEEEVIRVTNDEYVAIKRQDIAGEYDVIVDVSTPEKDNETAEKLNMLMQTNGASMHPEMSKLIYAKIAKLWKQPDLVEKIESFQPEPDPMQEKIAALQMENAELENKKLKMEIAKMAKGIESEDSKIDERDSRTSQNIESEARENDANARLKNAQASKIEEEADLTKLDFMEKKNGTKRKQEIENIEMAHLSKQELEEDKHRKALETKEFDSLTKFEDDELAEARSQENPVGGNNGTI